MKCPHTLLMDSNSNQLALTLQIRQHTLENADIIHTIQSELQDLGVTGEKPKGKVVSRWNPKYKQGETIPLCKLFHDAIYLLSFPRESESPKEFTDCSIKLHSRKLHGIHISMHNSKGKLLMLTQVITNHSL